jgi:hypothetical protein
VAAILVNIAVYTTRAGTRYYLYRTDEYYYWSTNLDTTSVLRQFPPGYNVVEEPSGQPLLVPVNKAMDRHTLDSLAREQTLGAIWRLPQSN